MVGPPADAAAATIPGLQATASAAVAAALGSTGTTGTTGAIGNAAGVAAPLGAGASAPAPDAAGTAGADGGGAGGAGGGGGGGAKLEASLLANLKKKLQEKVTAPEKLKTTGVAFQAVTEEVCVCAPYCVLKLYYGVGRVVIAEALKDARSVGLQRLILS